MSSHSVKREPKGFDPEERFQRKLMKRLAKEQKNKEELGYTDTENPFGDEHLTDTFVWGKKLEKEGKTGLSADELDLLKKRTVQKNKEELEKVKLRRLEHEREKEEREQLKEMVQREKEAEYFREWAIQEATFHLDQAKLRSKIRIDDGRAKPVDILAHYISCDDEENITIEMHEPYKYLTGLQADDLEDLLEDIKVYQELHQTNNDYQQYWTDIRIVAQHELDKIRQFKRQERERRDGINSAVMKDVSSVFKGKTSDQLTLLESQIKKKLEMKEGVDTAYWETLLVHLQAEMAVARLAERHKRVLHNRLFKLKKAQGLDSQPLFPVEAQQEEEETPQPEQVIDRFKSEPSTSTTPSKAKVVADEELSSKIAVDEYELGRYSPQLLSPTEIDIDTKIYDFSDDMQKLEFQREQVRMTGQVQLESEEAFMTIAKKGMSSDEASYGVEANLGAQKFLWSDKYHPRKPRFFNRVHTGYEWNKYNQTHYDLDCPPPKIVQGYKFNIFYPDLIDKSKTPEYTLTPCEDNIEFAILRFKAGPPYEDIAFKVVSREWDVGFRSGFKSQFHNGVFQLWFYFKRYRYRR